MSDLGRALVDSLDDQDLERLAVRLVDRVGPRLLELLGPGLATPEDGWMPTAEAARYLGLTTNALHKLTAARAVPFEQDGRGGKMWFKRSELDSWRRNGSPSSIVAAAPPTEISRFRTASMHR